VKRLSTITIGKHSFALEQSTTNGTVDSPTVAGLVNPNASSWEFRLHASVQQLHTAEPELIVFSWIEDQDSARIEASREAILAWASEQWRQHYDPADFAEAVATVPEGAQPSRPVWSRVIATETFLCSAAVATAIGLFFSAVWIADGYETTVVVYALHLSILAVVVLAVAGMTKLHRRIRRSAPSSLHRGHRPGGPPSSPRGRRLLLAAASPQAVGLPTPIPATTRSNRSSERNTRMLETQPFPLSNPGGLQPALEHTPGTLRPFVTTIAVPSVPQAGGTEPTFVTTNTDGNPRMDTQTDQV
jgi:hypothetical protein